MNDLEEKIMCLVEEIMRLSPIKRWLVIFFVFGLFGTLCGALAFIPVAMLLGLSLSAVISPAIGCGIGIGLVNATHFLLFFD